jgi:hypothetical protein
VPQAPVARGAGRYNARGIGALARQAESLRDEALPYLNGDWNLATAWAANVILESGGRTDSRESGGRGPGRGLMQITDRGRKANFLRHMGVDIDHADRPTQLRFGLDYERNTDPYESQMWRRAQARGHDPASLARGISRWVERPSRRDRDQFAAERAAVAAAMPQAPPRR